MAPLLRSRPVRTLLCASALVLWVACGTLVAPQGWQPDFGPVVPHDTFPGDCSLCHTGTDWHTLRQDFEFDHAAETGVPLHGAHRDTLCLYCHNDRGPVARFAARGCGGCHEDVHRGQLGPNCADCHDEDTWRPDAQIERHDRTRFPLVGPHAAAACFRCHPGAQVGNFHGASPRCEVCHPSEFERAAFDHVAQGFTSDCDRCHRPVSWLPALVEHPASFPLVGGHAGHRCTDCHAPSTYSGLSTQCVSCHQDDQTRATEPNHVQAGFQSCEQCHTVFAWLPSSFTHTPSFPLTFGHSGRRCSECHQGGVYAGTASTCASCHLDDYQATQNPPHQQAGYGTGCEQCHDTRGWGGANFVHRFPRTGPHNRACADCHTTPNNYQAFSCTHCHAHRQSEMNSEHSNVNGYVWSSPDCLRCHPNGREN